MTTRAEIRAAISVTHEDDPALVQEGHVSSFARTLADIESLPAVPPHVSAEERITDHEDYDPNRWNLH